MKKEEGNKYQRINNEKRPEEKNYMRTRDTRSNHILVESKYSIINPEKTTLKKDGPEKPEIKSNKIYSNRININHPINTTQNEKGNNNKYSPYIISNTYKRVRLTKDEKNEKNSYIPNNTMSSSINVKIEDNNKYENYKRTQQTFYRRYVIQKDNQPKKDEQNFTNEYKRFTKDNDNNYLKNSSHSISTSSNNNKSFHDKIGNNNIEKFEGIKRLFDGHESWKIGECERVSLDIVIGLTDILKEINQKSPNNNLVDRVCKFIDEISKKECGIWGLSRYERNGEILFSFLNELAADKKFVPQIDRIFRSGGGVYPLVNWISSNYKNKFNELFQKLPEWYQNELLGETISYEEGDKTYTCSLIGGTALMGF